jgi:hypothetical protein
MQLGYINMLPLISGDWAIAKSHSIRPQFVHVSLPGFIGPVPKPVWLASQLGQNRTTFSRKSSNDHCIYKHNVHECGNLNFNNQSAKTLIHQQLDYVSLQGTAKSLSVQWAFW